MKLFNVPRSGTVRLTEHWRIAKDGDPQGLWLYERHYSCYDYKDGRERKLFMGPGEKLVLLTENGDALFGWRKFIECQETAPKGINCSVFRNESQLLSSMLILEAERVAQCRWPGERMYTYVKPDAIRSTNPGACFKHAGWKFIRVTKGGLHELEKAGSVA